MNRITVLKNFLVCFLIASLILHDDVTIKQAINVWLTLRRSSQCDSTLTLITNACYTFSLSFGKLNKTFIVFKSFVQMSLLHSIIQVEKYSMGEQYSCQRRNLNQNPKNKKKFPYKYIVAPTTF